MSVLEFIAAWKWPVVVLVALAVVSRGFKNPENGRWLRDFVGRRDINVKLGPAEAAATLSAAAGDAVQAAVSTDAELAASSSALEQPGPVEAGPAEEAAGRTSQEITGFRREAVEAVMRASARWGWEMAQMGFRTAPNPQIQWTDDGRPEILYGAGSFNAESAFASPAPRSLTPDEILRRLTAVNEPQISDEARRAAIQRRLEAVLRGENREDEH